MGALIRTWLSALEVLYFASNFFYDISSLQFFFFFFNIELDFHKTKSHTTTKDYIEPEFVKKDLWWYRKTISPDSSRMGRADQWQQPMRISSMSKTNRTRLLIISSWANSARPTLYCFGMDIAPLFRNWQDRCEPLPMMVR